jgi:hypothetical protein
MSTRLDDLRRFYAALDALQQRLGGHKRLGGCDGRVDWPQRGVYFFMEDGERRSDSGEGQRVVRVGTHALTSSAKTTLWNRLSQHKGQEKSGGGNHRGSVFRLLVGSTLMNAGTFPCPTWGTGSNASRDVRVAEEAAEREVSRIIRAMPFLWLPIDDAPGPASQRGYIERNSIALLSNLGKPPLDPASPAWRGRLCDRGKARVRDSGLWNQNHVDEPYDPGFIEVLKELVDRTEARE